MFTASMRNGASSKKLLLYGAEERNACRKWWVSIDTQPLVSLQAQLPLRVLQAVIQCFPDR